MRRHGRASCWDPGDGNDLVDGGPGTDRMAFNGSNIGELIDVTDNAGRVRVTRNIGTITLELDNTETLDVTAVGGPDTITVNNLAGTDLTTLNTNLAASGGGDAPDGVADSIIVNGTAGDDTIDIVADEADVVVLGLTPTVRIAHADPTVDGLTVNGLEGNDTIAPTPDAEAVIVLTVVP